MNKLEKIYLFLAVVSLIIIFFLPAIILLPQILPYLSEPSNPTISLFYLAEGFAFFALAFLALALTQNNRGVKKPLPPIVIFASGSVLIYAGYAKLLCGLNETNFFVYLAGTMLVFLAIFQKLKK